MKPVRIQRQRTKGWKMPENTVNVTRPSGWGNPFVVSPNHPDLDHYADYTKNVDIWINWPVKDAETAVRAFREMRCTESFVKLARSALRGKNLACFCRLGDPCHADVLLELANEPVIEPIPPGPWVCPHQRDNEPCDCPECQRRMLT